MGKPEWNQLGIEAQSAGLGIGDAGEMFEADESDAPAVYHQLTGIRRTYSNHQHDVDVGVDLEKIAALVFSVSRESDDVHPLEHRAQISPSCKSSRSDYFREMRAIRLDDVVRPVGFEETAVVVEVAEICRDAIGAVQDCEEVGQQVDQHQQPGSRYGGSAARSKDARKYADRKFPTRAIMPRLINL